MATQVDTVFCHQPGASRLDLTLSAAFQPAVGTLARCLNSLSTKDKAYAAWRAKYVCSWGSMLYVQQSVGQGTVSEAIGYGLLNSVLADGRADFEGLLAFYNAFPNEHGLMCWNIARVGRDMEVHPDPAKGARGSATDGDLDAAYALLLAGQLWGDQAFVDRGLQVCAALMQHCVHPDTHVPLVGDWVARCCEHQGTPYASLARPSDFCLGHFALFAQLDTERSTQWARVLDACIAQLAVHLSDFQHGLVPDFVALDPASGRYMPVQGRVLERADDACFSYNACRLPWRLAVYYRQSRDERVRPLLAAMAEFFERQEVLAAGYTLDGRPLTDYPDLCFLAPAWGLLQVMESAHECRMRDAIEANVGGGHASYYGETILMLVDLQLRQPLF